MKQSLHSIKRYDTSRIKRIANITYADVHWLKHTYILFEYEARINVNLRKRKKRAQYAKVFTLLASTCVYAIHVPIHNFRTIKLEYYFCDVLNFIVVCDDLIFEYCFILISIVCAMCAVPKVWKVGCELFFSKIIYFINVSKNVRNQNILTAKLVWKKTHILN